MNTYERFLLNWLKKISIFQFRKLKLKTKKSLVRSLNHIILSFQKNFELRTSLLELIKFKMFLSKSNAIAFQLRKNVSMLQPRVMVSGAQKYISEDKMIWSIIPTCYLVISTLQLRFSKKIKNFKFFEFFHDFWANSAENALETIARDRARLQSFDSKTFWIL